MSQARCGGGGRGDRKLPWVGASRGGGSWLRVRVQPRSRRAAIEGVRAGQLLLRVTAPPAEGEANRAACELVARALGLPRRAVSVAAGGSGRSKLLHVGDLSPAAVRERLGAQGIAID